MVVMEHLNAGYLQLGLVALVFGGLQIWWIGSNLRKRELARTFERGRVQQVPGTDLGEAVLNPENLIPPSD